jgi:hypothetical protein
MYFQLVPSTPRTEGIEPGLSHTNGLLKTPTVFDGEASSGKAHPVSGNSGSLAQEIMSEYPPTMMKLGLIPTATAQDYKKRGPNSKQQGLPEAAYNRMLPTPTVFDSTGASANMKSSQVKDGSMHSMTLARYVMLPTPTAIQRDHPERVEGLKAKGAKTMRSRVNGDARPNSILDALNFHGMLPTPRATKTTGTDRDDFTPSLPGLMNKGLLPTPRANKVNGCDLNSENLANRNHCNLEEVVAGWVVGGMLPTPTVNDGPNSCLPQSQADRHSGLASVMLKDDRNIGETHQLNPAFVGEMMGFPPDWTLNPFIQGGTEIGQPTDFSNFPQFNPTISKGEIQDMDGVTASKWRNESIKAYGNAIVPEVAYNIFQAINKYENR